MCMMDKIRAKRDEIYAIARKHKAEKLWVFGSCAKKEVRPDSDVDFLVKFNPSPTLSDYLGMQDSFKRMLGRNVDVVSHTALERSPCFAYNVRKEMSEI